jgi:hypothetical protein
MPTFSKKSSGAQIPPPYDDYPLPPPVTFENLQVDYGASIATILLWFSVTRQLLYTRVSFFQWFNPEMTDFGDLTTR